LISALFLILSQSNPITGGNFEAFLQIDAPTQATKFGAAIDGVGDVDGDGIPDFIVGSRLEDNAYIDAGGAYPYERLGFAICAAGDANHDGYDDFAISSAPYSDSGTGARGTVYLMSGLDGSILHTILDPGPVNSWFGNTLTNAGDLDGDSHPDLAVGCPHYSPDAINVLGAVLVYSGAAGVRLRKIVGQQINGDFGASIAVISDMDGDGTDDFIIGAPRAATSGIPSNGEGMAFVYSSANTGTLLSSLGGWVPGSRFGAQVCSPAPTAPTGVELGSMTDA